MNISEESALCEPKYCPQSEKTSCGNHAITTEETCKVSGLLFIKMSSDDVAKSVGRKLKYYMQIKRREDGFDLSGAYLPQQDYPPLKPRPLMLYHDERMHDRSLKHYFHSPNVKTKIQKLGPPKSPYNQREGKVRRRIDRVVTKTQFVEPLIQDFNAPHSPRGRRRSPSRRARLRPSKKVLRRSPPSTITKGEAQRLVSVATKLLVATETVDLDSLPGYHRGPTGSYPEVTSGRLPTLAGGRVPQRPQSAPAKEQKKRRVKYTWDINGRRVPVEPYMYVEPGSDEDPDREPTPPEYNGMNIAVSNGSTRHIPEWLQLQMSKLDMEGREAQRQVRPKSAKWRRGRRATSPRSHRPYSAHPTSYYPPVPPEMYLDLPPTSPPAGVPPYAWSPESMDMATQTMEEIGTQTDLEDSGMSTLHSGKVSSKPSVTEEVAYEVSVHTADRPAASLNPEAAVFVQLHGKKGETEEVALQESKTHKMAFQKGQIDRFDVQTTDVGRLLSITVGHKHTDTDCVWYLDKVIVKRLGEPAVTYEFLCKCQLSAEDNKAVMELPLNWCSTELDESDKTLSSSSSESDFSEESETESELGSKGSHRSGSQKSGSHGSGSESSVSQKSGSERSGSQKSGSEKLESEAESRKSEAESGKSERSRRSEGSRKSVGSRKSEESARSTVSRKSEQSRSSERSGKSKGKASEKTVERTTSPDLDSKRKRRHRRPESRSSHSGLDDEKMDSDKEAETEREVVLRPKTARGRKVPRHSNSEQRPSDETKGLTQLLIVHPEDEEAKSDVEYSATDNDSVAVTDRSEKMSYVEPSSDSSLSDDENEPYYQKGLLSDRDMNEEQQEETPRGLVNYSDTAGEGEGSGSEEEEGAKAEDSDSSDSQSVHSARLVSEVEIEKPQVETMRVVQDPEPVAMAHGPPPKKALLKQVHHVPRENLVTIVAEVHVPTPAETVVLDEPGREETVPSEAERTETVTSEPEGTETAPSESARTETVQEEAEDLNEITPPTSPTIEASEGSLSPRRLSDVGETSGETPVPRSDETSQKGEEERGQGSGESEVEGEDSTKADGEGDDEGLQGKDADEQSEQNEAGENTEGKSREDGKEEENIEDTVENGDGDKEKRDGVDQEMEDSGKGDEKKKEDDETKEETPEEAGVVFMEGFKAGLEAVRKSSMSTASPSASMASLQAEEPHPKKGPTIHQAAKIGDLDRLKELATYSEELMSQMDERGWTPLHVACANGRLEVVKHLSVKTANLYKETPTGYTPMHIAAMNGHVNCMMVLHAMGCPINSRSADSQTPLHLAAMNGHPECCKWLLANRASLDAKDAMERSALELAEEYKHDAVAELLRTCRKELGRKDSSLSLLRTSGTSKDADVGEPVEESEETETWHDDKEEPPKKTEKGKEDDSSAKDSEEEGSAEDESDKLDDTLPEAVKKKEKEALLDRKRSYQEQQEKMTTTNTSFLDAIRSEFE
ncbi:ANK2 [Branchiostoma lanceolatum]|uniref:ANK2 protein n=1 Tax=Branchiostoma lanceolatum TaxID=7740 RepID=A0A8K0ABZ3_BRALA|nr:ANK2 [Branchiostoma lanceolatum]